ncbi:MAG: outer membrane protein assembly complex, YaeT protein, partial [Bacteroidota bacterium]|nr:outer membrane protein assembly complex, YaeT protein [Bacteroidota bacterium]
MTITLKQILLITALFVSSYIFGQGTDTLPVFDYSKGEGYEIGGVRVEGAKFLDAKILTTLSGLAKGDKVKIPGEQIPKAIKALWRQRLFTNVSIVAEKIEGGKIYLVIHVQERPRISKYSIKGIKNSDADEIKKKIDLRAGNIFTENMRSLTINTIKNYYIDKGFHSVKVFIREDRDTVMTNSVIIRISVEKGPKVKIDQINFYGNQAFPASKLRNQMKETHEKPQFDVSQFLHFRKNLQADSTPVHWYDVPGNLSPSLLWKYWQRHTHVNLNIFRSSKFKRDDYEDDKNKVQEFYANHGYRDAHITSDTVYLEDDKNMRIDIHVNEGRKYYFRNIYFNGNTKYPDSILARIVNIKRGEVYSQKILDEKIFMNPNGGDV